MLKTGTVILCMMLIAVSCKPRSSQDPSPQDPTSSDSISDTTSNMSSDDNVYEEDSLRIALPGECKDSPDNLIAYSDSLLNGINSLTIFCCEEIIRVNVRKNIKKTFAELQRYKEGKRKYYPQEDVYKILSFFQEDLALLISHSDNINDLNTINIFFRLMEQAVRLCPDINFLSKVCSQDHRLGTLDFHDAYSLGVYYSLIYRKPNGQYGILSFKGYGEKINHIRMIEETATCRRYLVSIEPNKYYSLYSFQAWIVDLYSNGKTRVIIPSNTGDIINEWENMIEYREDDDTYKDVKLIFNPQSLRWSYCLKKDSVYCPIKGSKDIALILKNNSAYFSIQ